MKKTILGLVATAAIAAPLVLGSTAGAATTSGSTCTPSDATTAVTHTEYQWAALVTKGGLHWDYKWTATAKNPSTDILHVWVKSLDLTKRGLPQITRTVVDVEAKDAVTCSVTPPQSGPYEVRFSDTRGTHIDLPDVFDIEHTEYAEGTYWSTQIRVNVINDTNTDQEFRIRYADVQDGDRVWVERAIFTDGMPNNVVPANSSRPLVLDVWHNAVSGADVPDDLTLDLGFELA